MQWRCVAKKSNYQANQGERNNSFYPNGEMGQGDQSNGNKSGLILHSGIASVNSVPSVRTLF